MNNFLKGLVGMAMLSTFAFTSNLIKAAERENLIIKYFKSGEGYVGGTYSCGIFEVPDTKIKIYNCSRISGNGEHHLVYDNGKWSYETEFVQFDEETQASFKIEKSTSEKNR